MALNSLGIEVPASTDAFDPDGDIRSLGDSLAGRIIVPVANVTERNALATTLSPTPSEPLYVHRADAPVYARTEWTEDGSNWNPVYAGDSGWIALPALAAGFTPQDSPGYRIKAGELRMRGALVWTGSGGPTKAFTLPSNAWPPTGTRRFAAGIQAISSTAIRVDLNGDVLIYLSSATGQFISLNNVRYDLD